MVYLLQGNIKSFKKDKTSIYLLQKSMKRLTLNFKSSKKTMKKQIKSKISSNKLTLNLFINFLFTMLKLKILKKKSKSYEEIVDLLNTRVLDDGEGLKLDKLSTEKFCFFKLSRPIQNNDACDTALIS